MAAKPLFRSAVWETACTAIAQNPRGKHKSFGVRPSSAAGTSAGSGAPDCPRTPVGSALLRRGADALHSVAALPRRAISEIEPRSESGQVGVTHEVTVALARRAASFVEGPDDQALAPAAVAGREHLRNAGLVFAVFSLDVSARVAFHT